MSFAGGRPDCMSDDDFRVRGMRPKEIALAVDWAAAEGWNPGLADAGCFASADPGGFLVGEFQGKPAATLSVVNHDARFAFLGFYIVRAELRGRGFGWRTWQAGIERAGQRSIGLDGVVAQQDNYRKSGFDFAYNNVRYGGVPAGLRGGEATVPLRDVPFELVARDDAAVFPADRTAFVRGWIEAQGHTGRALMRNGRLVAWGVIRPCRRGRKVGPLVADDRAAAAAVLAELAGDEGGEIFLDVPQPNRDAVGLAQSLALTPVFQTARMYRGRVRPVALHKVFGVTTFELG
jgi:Acetyltransferase (GNAT) domain/Acetyltransferase (GNAT) family